MLQVSYILFIYPQRRINDNAQQLTHANSHG
jgi:hypothetical protein